jgi:hypothetical protein
MTSRSGLVVCVVGGWGCTVERSYRMSRSAGSDRDRQRLEGATHLVRSHVFVGERTPSPLIWLAALAYPAVPGMGVAGREVGRSLVFLPGARGASLSVRLVSDLIGNVSATQLHTELTTFPPPSLFNASCSAA